ncbi:nitroreductase family protein [Sorangium sp. So ce176]|uniref:nitroreductase family protein n=1 Tax=Sorangium sp. So ce176 TaxID=3133286 RepID=UPI003F62A605
MNESPDLLDLVVGRRSVAALAEPGPSAEQLERILLAAGAVPDHGLLRPFRFVVAEGDGRARFGDALAASAAEHAPGMPEKKLDSVRAKAFRSPTIVALIASPKPGKIALWEQSATAACAGYAIVLAAHALGVGAVWKSVPFTKGRALAEALGLRDDEEMLGWIHLGTPARDEPPAPRPPLATGDIASVLEPGGLRPWR